MTWAPLARILLNTVGAYLVGRGMLDAETADTITSNQDVIQITAGALMIGVQYVGYAVAKARGWST